MEKFILLAHHPDKAKFIVSELQINYGMVGAMFLKLSFEEKIDIRDGKLIVRDRHEISNPHASELVRMIVDSGRSKEIKYWISKFGNKARPVREKVMEGLQRKGVLSLEKKKALWLFPYTKSRVKARSTRESLVSEMLRKALSPKALSADDTIILALIESCKMHHALTSDKGEIRELKSTLKKILADSPVASTLDQTVQEVQTAILVSIIATTSATMAATSVSSS
ncbi:MAG: GPP34 family phosphoprotein [Cyclobacteriaceae bacterium]